MKERTRNAIIFISISALLVGVIVAKYGFPQEVTLPHRFSSLEVACFTANAHTTLNRGQVVFDTAIDFQLGEKEWEGGISNEGIYTGTNQAAIDACIERTGEPPIIVSQYVVTLSGFKLGTVLTDNNAILDDQHNAMIFKWGDGYKAFVITG